MTHAGPVVIKVGGTMVEDPKTSPRRRCVERGGEAAPGARGGRGGGARRREGGGPAPGPAGNDHRAERRDPRITPAEQLDEIVGVLAGRVNKSIVGQFLRIGVRAVGLCLGDGGAVPTAKTTRYSFDPGRVGDVVEWAGGGPRRQCEVRFVRAAGEWIFAGAELDRDRWGRVFECGTRMMRRRGRRG